MKKRTAQSQITFDQPLQEVFRFFCRPENLNDITPNFLQFHITSPTPVKMQEKVVIDYRLKLFGVPFKWQTLIQKWQPPFYFTDKQQKGPFILWEHQHIFEEKNGQVIMTDSLTFIVPGWFLEPLIYHFFVKNWIDKILQYRNKKALQIFSKRKVELL